ncbi:hypothetical protein EVAR_45546_1 [Eumeta japonica]|uniref:Uncharacterized protein n=1 Tax=Eumeta variegata TaxID=151549 RepID=A0A4C1X6D3_EUMVA|nr:hypothetical protein EVAR_45546_1 [Eumeta japonica]
MDTRNPRGVTSEFLEMNRISNEGGIRLIETSRGSGPHDISYTGRKATAEDAASKPYSVRVWYFTRRAESWNANIIEGACIAEAAPAPAPPLPPRRQRAYRALPLLSR